MRVPFVICAIAVLSIAVPAASPADTPEYVPGPWHYKSISCVDTTVKNVGPRLVSGKPPYPASDYESGVEVGFASGLGVKPLFNETAAVVHYQGDAGNGTMRAEKPGDKVQLCFLGGPAPTTYCNPDKDERGRRFRVWDYARKAQYAGTNSEHDCGGA